jgi:ABC-type Mn2+/Zn2+ transport system ATPase subunit
MSLLNVEKLNIYEPGSSRCLLQNVDLTIDQGQILWLKGPNGLGKTQLLLNLMRQIDKESSFTHAYLPQNLSAEWLFSSTVQDMLHFFPPDAALAVLVESLDPKKHWNVLSGGERQRLGLWFTLSEDVDLYFLDEPMNHLDKAHCAVLNSVMTSMAKEKNKSFVVVSHEPIMAEIVRALDLEEYLP